MGTTARAEDGYTYFLTLSAPGENDHRKWVQGWKKRDGARPDCTCHHTWEHQSKGQWNAQESACWNRLRTALGRLCDGSMTYIASVEVQDGKRVENGRKGRDLLHRHIVLHSAVPLTPHQVGDLALAAGYGCVHDLEVVRSASKAAWYISKYVTKSSGDRGQVPWVKEVTDEHTGEVQALDTVATFRTWSAARNWGFTLKGLREIARTQARARAEALRALATSPPLVVAANGSQASQLVAADPP